MAQASALPTADEFFGSPISPAPKSGALPSADDFFSSPMPTTPEDIGRSARQNVPRIMQQAQFMAAQTGDMASRSGLLQGAEEALRAVRGRMPAEQADYDTPIPWSIKAHLAAADPVTDDAERKLVIDQLMPGSEISYDPGGRLMVKPPGAAKFQSADSGGFWSNFSAQTAGTI